MKRRWESGRAILPSMCQQRVKPGAGESKLREVRIDPQILSPEIAPKKRAILLSKKSTKKPRSHPAHLFASFALQSDQSRCLRPASPNRFSVDPIDHSFTGIF